MGWEQAFEEYLKPFGDLHGDKWQDNPVDAVFRGGYELGLKAQHEASFRAGVEAAACLIENGYDRPRATMWRADGVHSKHDKCPHGVWMYEDCEQCAPAAIRAIPTPPLTKESE